MRPLRIVLLLALLSPACGGGVYDDSGQPYPGQWWPWVCPDGGYPAPDAGCLPACPTGGIGDGGVDGGC
ncbi:MAG: hypothetical protein ACYCWW_09855 [Deltaproteobacteria bacterium]